jgi:hypothetical protein
LKKLALSNGKVALVSDEDWPLVSQFTWSDRGGGYIRARFRKDLGGDGRFIYLHRLVTGAQAGLVVDHIDRNPLNNTRENLQVITQARNLMRKPAPKNGVTRQGKWWRVRIRVDGRLTDFGSFDNEADAQAAAVKAKRTIWGDPSINTGGAKR